MNATIPSIFDPSALGQLKLKLKGDDPQALKSAAQQFEALFLQMVLKSMRDATPRDGFLDSEQTRLYESLLDQQLAQVLAARGGTGLATVIEKQLARPTVTDPETFPAGLPLPGRPASAGAPSPALAVAVAPATPAAPAQPMPRGATPAARDFIDRLWPHAQAASQASGIPAPFLLAQAALETGWGRAELQHADGRPSYNVFGIKAGKNWNGPVVEATTTEYVDGVPQQRIERFRAYASYGEAFQDYLRLLAGNSRYGAVMGAGNAREFALGLQRAGYATDPNYADKLTRIIGGLTPAAA